MAGGQVAQIAEYQAPDQDPNDPEGRILEAAKPILGRLDSEVRERMRLRGPTERRWIEDLRAYYGRYEPTLEKELRDAHRSTAFIKLTRTKTNGWAARLSDLLFPTDEKNWAIQPTPVPTLAKEAKKHADMAKAAADKATQQSAEGDQAGAAETASLGDALAQKVADLHAQIGEAKTRCDAMQETIDDQLTEANYAVHARDVIEDGCKLGTGIMKGPMTSNRLRRRWVESELGFVLEQDPDPTPEFRRVDPWHFFPDMSARTIEESESEYERHLPTKKDLRKMALKLGFNKDAVRRLLREGPGIMQNLDHLAILREIVGEGEIIKDRYVMWEFHGSLETEEVVALLMAAGKFEDARRLAIHDDPLEEHRVIMFFCNGEVLKIEPDYPLDSGETLYSVWNFEKGETSIFGVGVPHLMNHSQASLNGAWRMMMDNGALSVGPQIVMNKDQVEPQDKTWGLRALKVWLRTSTSAATPGDAPFQIFNVPSNQQQLQGIIEIAKELIDEETSMPQIAQGEQGAAGQTLGGMSMLFNSANVVFRRVVKSFDDELTKPTIRRAYDWNMQFNNDNTVKGDMQVDARGSSVLLVREIQSQNLMNIMSNWTVHPVIGAYIKVRAGLTKALQTMLIAPDDILFTQDEADQRQAQAQKAQAALAQQNQKPGDNGETAIKVATINSEARVRAATISANAAMEQVAADHNMTQAELQAHLAEITANNQSKERIMAAKIGVEAQRAREAEAHGQPPEKAVGVGVG